MSEILHFCVLLLLSCFGPVITNEQGERIPSLSIPRSIRESRQQVADILTAIIQGTNLDSFSGKDGDFEFWVSGLTVSSFHCPSNFISLQNGQHGRMNLKIKGITTGIDAKFRYEIDLVRWLPNIKDSGGVSVKIENLSIDLPIHEERDNKFKVDPGKCKGNVGSVSLKFSGSWSWLYEFLKWAFNLLGRSVEKWTEELIEKKVCKALEDNINKFGSALHSLMG